MFINKLFKKNSAAESNIFFVISEGYAADHLFSWFSKSLNKHEEVFSLMAHEGSRPKYLNERTRGERPNIINFCEFLKDMGMTFGAIGDCYSYRYQHIKQLKENKKFQNIPVLYLLRNPLVWAYFYQQWRCNNMRMASNKINPIEWEWKTSNHNLFNYLKLRDYKKDEVYIWSFYQALYLLNLQSENLTSKYFITEKIEDIYENKNKFVKVFKFLTKIKEEISSSFVERIFYDKEKLYNGETKISFKEENILDQFEDWQIDAYNKIVKDSTKKKFENFYSNLPQIKKNYNSSQIFERPIFISSLPKSGTHLLRSLVQNITGKNYYEPFQNEIEEANKIELNNYNNTNLIYFKKNQFFSWHNIINKNTQSLLLSSQSANIFLIRNIYEIIFSFYNHLKEDVDKEIKRSVNQSDIFFKDGVSASIYNLINGFTSKDFSFFGIEVILNQLYSFYEFSKISNDFLLLSYNDLINDKNKTLKNIINYLNLKTDETELNRIVSNSNLNEEQKKNIPHITKNRDEKLINFRSTLHKGHIGSVDFQINKAFKSNTEAYEFFSKYGILDIKYFS